VLCYKNLPKEGGEERGTKMFRPTALLLTVSLLALCNICAHAQQPLETLDDIPDAPTPKTLSMSSDVQLPKPKPEHKLEKRSFRLMQSLLIYSALEDLSTTNNFLHHPQYVEYRGVCGGKPCSSMSYGHNPLWFTEVGRPPRILGCDPRAVGCSIASVAANDAAIFGASELLHHKGKFGKTLAWGILVSQVTSNFQAAWHNKHVVLDQRRYVPSGATDISWYNQ
jgi:hypothetical protein